MVKVFLLATEAEVGVGVWGAPSLAIIVSVVWRVRTLKPRCYGLLGITTDVHRTATAPLEAGCPARYHVIVGAAVHTDSLSCDRCVGTQRCWRSRDFFICSAREYSNQKNENDWKHFQQVCYNI